MTSERKAFNVAATIRIGQAMTTNLRGNQIERAVRAVIRGGARQLRVVVDYASGRVEIEARADDAPEVPRSFDAVDFRAKP